jgi:hypothetical protein
MIYWPESRYIIVSGVYGGAFGLGIADALGADVETVRARTVFFLLLLLLLLLLLRLSQLPHMTNDHLPRQALDRNKR